VCRLLVLFDVCFATTFKLAWRTWEIDIELERAELHSIFLQN